MAKKSTDKRPMSLEGVRVELSTQKPIVLLKEEDGDRYLPIWIGPYEATAIALELAGVKPPRPMTHDLMKSMLDAFGASVESVVVDDLVDNTFYATIFIDMNGKTFEINSRPSDAIALAVRSKSPIFAVEFVLQAAGIVVSSIEEEVKKFRDFLENVEPEDFNKFK